jgi:iron complex outermembrane receptor protein
MTKVEVDGSDRADSLRTYQLEEAIVVSATKLPAPLASVPSAVSVLTTSVLRESSAETIPAALAQSAGLHSYDFTGTGQVATAEARGFAAFGETSHLRFLVDGLPFSDLMTDNGVWNLLDLDQLARVEVIRSASATLHGNTSFTGVVNLVPRGAGGPSFWGRAEGGAYGRGEAAIGGAFDTGSLTGVASASWRNVDGFRDHSRWRGTSSFGTLKTGEGTRGRGRLGVFFHEYDAELPGALTAAQLEDDREQALVSPGFDGPFDRDENRSLYVTASWERTEGLESPFRVAGSLNVENHDIIRTIFFTPLAEERRTVAFGAQATWRAPLERLVGVPAKLLVGVEAALGSVDSDFRGVNTDGSTLDLVAAGDIGREQLAEFARLESDLGAGVQLSVGIRRDDVRGDLEADADDPLGVATSERTMDAWSPSAALNYSWDGLSNAYVQYSRSFKTPTLNQLYDVRPFDTDGPGGAPPITISNGSLDPQFADQFEIGMRGRTGGDAHGYDVALYTMDVEDEIGFDLATFSYDNLVESRHRGLEMEVFSEILPRVRASVGYTFTEAEFRKPYGAFDESIVSNQINNVPEHLVTAALAYRGPNVHLGISSRSVQDQYADETNTVRVPNYTVVDGRASFHIGGQEFYANVHNLLDEEYESAGFMDFELDETFSPVPAARFFPSPGRRVEGGIRFAIR